MEPRILLTNDDGFEAEGLRRMLGALAEIGRVTVVAPEGEQSGTSHALTLHRPLRVRQRGEGEFSVDGTPTDCVHLALSQLLERPPDLVAAGINLGTNLGEDVTYSGTVAAALEAALFGLPAFAISLQQNSEAPDFGPAAAFGREVARRILHHGLPPGTFLNVNVPCGSPAAVHLTRQGLRTYHLEPRQAAGEGRLLWVRRNRADWPEDPEADATAVRLGRISVTPLHVDWTHHLARDRIRRWGLTGSGD
ncbi:MAG: 5'/3'-nucleotidase SurE [Acidobacteria bacterium]|nr:5'/3'-nucleotidase SurE [Acidobacteriota bacterium]